MRSCFNSDGWRAGCAWACAAIAFALSGFALAQDVPLVWGNYDIAHKFLHGNAHVLLLGDSIQNTMIGAYPEHWKVDKWVGQTVGPNLGSSPAGNTGSYNLIFNNPTPPQVNSNLTYLPSNPPAGMEGFGPGAMQLVTFNAVQAPAGGSLLSNRFYEVGLVAGQEQIYSSGKWADRPDGKIYVDVMLYGNPQGISSGTRVDVRTNSDTTPDLSFPINTRLAQPGLVKLSGSFDAKAWNPGRGMAASFRVEPGATPEAGSNLSILGVRFHTGEDGFQFTNIAWGGEGVDNYISLTRSTEKNLADYIAATDSNLAFVWLGQNDPIKYQPAQWKQKMQELIARYKSVRPDMDFVLVSTYDTGSPILRDYSKALYEIAQSDPDVLFLNLYRAAGDASFLMANYIGDTVHPNTAGVDYFAAKTGELLELADSLVPEPGTMLMAAGALWVAGRRRRG